MIPMAREDPGPGCGADWLRKGCELANSDEDLVARCQSGERSAFELLMRKYQRRIFHLVYRVTQDSDLVEPLSQEVFLKAYRALSSFKGNSQFYTWLYRIAVNTCLSHLKRESIESHAGGTVELDSVSCPPGIHAVQPDDPEQTVMRRELGRRILVHLRKLPEELKTTLVLREFMGLNYEEIADVMQIPLGTVRSRIFRARAQLKTEMAPFLA